MAMVDVCLSCLQAVLWLKSVGLVHGSAAAWHCSASSAWIVWTLIMTKSGWQHQKYCPRHYYYHTTTSDFCLTNQYFHCLLKVRRGLQKWSWSRTLTANQQCYYRSHMLLLWQAHQALPIWGGGKMSQRGEEFHQTLNPEGSGGIHT